MKNLDDLLRGITGAHRAGNLSAFNRPISGICQDSRKMRAGELFVAVKGTQSDGHAFIPQVLAKNPGALLVEDLAKIPADFDGPVVVTTSARETLNQLARAFYDDPSKKMFCVGITGTNGKTTTSLMVEHIFNSCSHRTGVIGTIDHHVGSKVWKTELTTPGTVELLSRLQEFVLEGADTLSMEVSSHALDQDRIGAVDFDVAVFTNLTQDHLDFHGTMEKYFEAKNLLFDQVLRRSCKRAQTAVVNADDPWSSKIRLAPKTRLLSFGLNRGDLTAELHSQSFEGMKLTIKFQGVSCQLHLRPVGLFNISNALGAIGAAIAGGISFDAAVRALSTFRGARGRLDRVDTGSGPHVFVDYAHTPDALEKTLGALRAIRTQSGLQNRIITVFGCGGDRDRAKRPLMGAVAEGLSDEVVVTSDNPRTENPDVILADILRGMGLVLPRDRIHSVVDRKSGIRLGLERAQENDVVLIAGKGHEDYQIIGTEKTHFDDAEIVTEILAERGKQ